MRTPASIRGHPLHPILITIPIGLWVFSLVCDLIALRSPRPEVYFICSLFTMIGGIVGALIAAVPGLIDLLSLKERHLRRIALIHMALNLFIVALYVVNLWLRIDHPPSPAVPVALSVAGIVLLSVSGWLGAELVHVHGVTVLNAGSDERNRSKG